MPTGEICRWSKRGHMHHRQKSWRGETLQDQWSLNDSVVSLRWWVSSCRNCCSPTGGLELSNCLGCQKRLWTSDFSTRFVQYCGDFWGWSEYNSHYDLSLSLRRPWKCWNVVVGMSNVPHIVWILGPQLLDLFWKVVKALWGIIFGDEVCH